MQTNIYFQLSVLLIVIVCTQFIICGWGLAMRETLPTSAELYVDHSFNEFAHFHSNANQTHTWNRIQYELKCCGVHGSTDYASRGLKSIPLSCFSRPENPEDHSYAKFYTRGCLQVLSNNSRELLLYTAVAAIVLAFAQVSIIYF